MAVPAARFSLDQIRKYRIAIALQTHRDQYGNEEWTPECSGHGFQSFTISINSLRYPLGSNA